MVVNERMGLTHRKRLLQFVCIYCGHRETNPPSAPPVQMKRWSEPKGDRRAANVKTGGCGLLLVGQAADHLAKCLVLRTSVALAEKVSKLNWREFPTGQLVGTVKNEHVVAFAA